MSNFKGRNTKEGNFVILQEMLNINDFKKVAKINKNHGCDPRLDTKKRVSEVQLLNIKGYLFDSIKPKNTCLSLYYGY